MERHVLSKSTFLRGVQCHKSLYLNKKFPYLRDRLSDAQKAVFKRGIDVGILARQLFPKGVDLSPKSPSQFRKNAVETAKIIRTDSFRVLYEAVFQFDKSLAILDILTKGSKSWVAYEVKSSVKISETYLLDAAFQYYVITHSGVVLEDFFLITINKDYVFDGALELEKLFDKQSVLSEVLERQDFIENKIREEKQVLQKSTIPEIDIGPWCNDPYTCDFLGHCWENVQENSILYLDAFDEEKRFSAFYSGKDDRQDGMEDHLTRKQKAQLWSARNRKCYVNLEMLHDLLGEIQDDVVVISPYFVRTAIPWLSGTSPYQLVPVACGVQRLKQNQETTFFVPGNNAIGLFVSFFRKLIESDSRIVIYDNENLLEFLKVTGHEDLIMAVGNQVVELSQVFKSGAVYDYQMKGDYSAGNVSRIFLKKESPLLDPSLLTMNWRIALAEQGHDKLLLENTKNYLTKLTDFQVDFMNLLKKPEVLISS